MVLRAEHNHNRLLVADISLIVPAPTKIETTVNGELPSEVNQRRNYHGADYDAHYKPHPPSLSQLIHPLTLNTAMASHLACMERKRFGKSGSDSCWPCRDRND